MELWINPECSKSRTAQDVLDEQGIAYTTRDYLEHPPTRPELEELLATLGPDIARDAGTDSTDELLDRLTADPGGLQRPIAFHDGKVLIARPPERVLELLSD